MGPQRNITQSTRSATLADILERVLDKGVVIAGDIRIKIVDIELLTIQIRLVVCSVERAVEMGMDWWTLDPNLSKLARREPKELPEPSAAPDLARRVEQLEALVEGMRAPVAG
ncbi:gas vesicle protein [Polyangium aurulentum]|uniref:gas vesicle protein n=1 Tax=Polyangium aurulentum TaxID=2567896 RepID=UPI0010AE0079|nr:gas vesicle protein [Polyangium aurulentum]UQA57626.1 gas vesicle protein [Polyangium aurulentum]